MIAGLWRWFFPTPEDRIESARAAVGQERFRDARDLVEGLEGAEAAEVRKAAENGLAVLNLQAALEYGRAGDDVRCAQHLELADAFHKGGLEERFRAARKELRESREVRKDEIRSRQQLQTRMDSADPLGLVGRGLLAETREPDLSPDEEERGMRFALAVENYPPELRARASRIGSGFVNAVLDLDDGRPDLALQALEACPDEALVRFEQARACIVLGDQRAAIGHLRAFANAAVDGKILGHRPIGNQHTAVMLAENLAEIGDVDSAIRVLRDQRAREANLGGVLLAQLLKVRVARGRTPEPANDLREATDALVAILGKSPHPQLWAILADVRLAADDRIGAMRALESSLAMCCSKPGKCGSHEPDPHTQRALAILYYEDGIEKARAGELADEVLAKVEQPAWEDVYIEALGMRATADPEAAGVAQILLERTPIDDPRRDRLRQHLGVG